MEDQTDNLAFPHFALIYIDRDGNLRQEASQSIAHSSETILSPRVRDAFLRAVAMSNNGPSPHLQCEFHASKINSYKKGHSTDLQQSSLAHQSPAARVRPEDKSLYLLHLKPFPSSQVESIRDSKDTDE